MGLLDLMLGTSGEGKQGIEAQSYKLPEKTHEFVHPVAVRREELDAVAELLEADDATPAIEGDTADLQEAFDELFDDEQAPDAATLVEKTQQSRRAVEAALDTWNEQISEELGVVYAQPETNRALAAFIKHCKQRDERDDDPFELPNSLSTVAPLLKRLTESTDEQYRAVVHTDLLPETDSR